MNEQTISTMPNLPCHYYTNSKGDVFITNSLYIAIMRAKAHGTSVFTYEKKQK